TPGCLAAEAAVVVVAHVERREPMRADLRLQLGVAGADVHARADRLLDLVTLVFRPRDEGIAPRAPADALPVRLAPFTRIEHRGGLRIHGRGAQVRVSEPERLVEQS